MNIISKFMARFRAQRAQPQPKVVLHDPERSEPRNLDDTFFDDKAQERVGRAISQSIRKD
jgi:hypothetical protein